MRRLLEQRAGQALLLLWGCGLQLDADLGTALGPALRDRLFVVIAWRTVVRLWCYACLPAGLVLTPHCAEKDTSTITCSSSSTPSTQYAAELYGLRKVFKGGRTPLRCRPTFMCGCSSSTAAGEDDAADGQDGLLDAVTAGGRSGRSWLSGGRRRDDFWAIRGTWLGIERGQLFCLLGPNGAGKTTTIHTLTGVLPFSGGDALIYGTSIKGEAGLDAVRPLMGVCPQFDVLWGELSGREHLTIAGHIKGLPWNKVCVCGLAACVCVCVCG